MKRGELAKHTGCNIETIRYYERIGLLADPPRTEAGHREYNDDHCQRLAFIRRGRELGFTLAQLRGLLGLVDGGDYTCDEIQQITLLHIKNVRAKISDLKKIEQALKEMASKCQGGDVPECHVIDAMFFSHVFK